MFDGLTTAVATDSYRVPAVTAAVAVLDALAAAPGSTLSELARRTGTSKSSLHNLLATLVFEQLVVRDERTRGFALGPRLVGLGHAAARRGSLLGAAIERLAPLADEHGLSFAVCQATGDLEVAVLERAYPPVGIHVGITRGSRYGPFDGALGKCLLAAQDAKRAARVVADAEALPRHTAQTITDPERLLDEVATVRARGWGASAGELNENNAVAAFLPGEEGRGLHLLALGFAPQLSAARIPAIGALLVDVAHALCAGAASPSTQEPA